MTNPNDTLIDDILNLQNSIDTLDDLLEMTPSDQPLHKVLRLIFKDLKDSYIRFLPYLKLLVDNSQIFDSAKYGKNDTETCD